jgi:hypothetical protein
MNALLYWLSTQPWPLFIWSVVCFLFGMSFHATVLHIRTKLIMRAADRKLNELRTGEGQK